MKQRGISCKLGNMFINIKVNKNHLLNYFETPHVSSNMFDICKPNCLYVLSFMVLVCHHQHVQRLVTRYDEFLVKEYIL